MSVPSPQHFVLSLGSNIEAERYIPYALETLRRELCITRQTPLMQTKPVDFPYPSADFTNVVLWGHTDKSREELCTLLEELEDYAGRRRDTPALVPLDADLLIWNGEVLKPKDLERPYMQGLL